MAKQVVTDDHRLTRIYIVEAYRKAGFVVGAPLWKGDGYYIPIAGNGLFGVTVSIAFLNNPALVSVHGRELNIANPSEDVLLDLTIKMLFDPVISLQSESMTRTIQLSLSRTVKVPNLDKGEPSLDTLRSKLTANLEAFIHYFQTFKGNLYTETAETLRLAKLHMTRDSNLPWREKLAIFLQDKAEQDIAERDKKVGVNP